MGSSCSSRHKKDDDSASTRSHESPSYQPASKNKDAAKGGNNGGPSKAPEKPATTNAAIGNAANSNRPAVSSVSGYFHDRAEGKSRIHSPVQPDDDKHAFIWETSTQGITSKIHPYVFLKLYNGAYAGEQTLPIRSETPCRFHFKSARKDPTDSASPGPSTRSGPSSTSAPILPVTAPTPAVMLAAPLPETVQQLPDNLQQLLLGRPAPPAAPRIVQRTRKIVLYVIAADSQDCCAEKGTLHRSVYPTLRGTCRERGYELHIVDLHWKSPLEKQQDHEFPELCLGELARQQDTAYVIPVLFLNNSLGTPLLPKTVEMQDFETALESAEDKSVLTKWYSFDTHSQPPCYTLRPIASHIPGFKEESPAERERALSEWRAETERALASLVGALSTDLRDTYLTTAVEQEVHNTVFMSPELARRTLWFSRTHVGPAAGSGGAGTTFPPAVDAEQRRRLETLHRGLKSHLCDKYILKQSVLWPEGGFKMELPEHAQYIAEVQTELTNHLRGIIDVIIEEDQSKTVLKSAHGISKRLFQELQHQSAFCQQAAQCSVNREAVLKQIEGYVTGDSKTPLVLVGPRGSGKTTVVARAAQRIATPDGAAGSASGASTPGNGVAVLIARFVGVSADSWTSEQLLAGLAQHAQLLLDGGCCWAPHTIAAYSELFPRLLGEVAAKFGTVVVLIDGLDQVKEYGGTSVKWIPKSLPAGVKLLVTAAESSTAATELTELLKDAPESVLKMAPLDQTEMAAILGAWVMQYNHSVDKDTVQAAVRDCTLPLYAKVVAWQTSWGKPTPTSDLESQIEELLKQLEQLLGREQLERCIALLSGVKYGLSDSEMLDVLALDPVFHSSSTYMPWALACLFWARINKLLGPFLHWVAVGDALVLQWRDASVREAVRKRYLAIGDGGAAEKAIRTLCSYFQGGAWAERTPVLAGRLLPQPNRTDKCYNRRKLEELPFLTHRLKKSLKDDFLLDQRWLYDKICGADVYQVLEDLALESSEPAGANPDPDLQLLGRCLQESAAALAYDGRQLFSQLYAQLVAARPADPPPSAAADAPPPDLKLWVNANTALSRRLLDACLSPPVPQLMPLPRPILPEDTEEGQIDLVYRIRDYPEYVVTVSTAKEEVAVWDVLRNTRVRTLRGLPQPLSLQPVDAHRCVVLCQRELRIYDLDDCTFVTRLKGVMNQKMPYYGMHDSKHLVALSRNRMYVNLMNLDSGDCVTTFKAGEDRFLNSLLVSGDGRVLVCGDETQKPFPLLVWNLASRKLLYDLRIPHHDFVTNLAAITHEGHYVCCVTKEVDEPSANFIVVYDLQSGTLFKKWKPGVNTVSLEISSKDACVISGLEDGRVLVWDLVTGACKWSLLGHTAPVDFLRLDADGGCFLSADSQARDRSLRLWDLNKGELVAVYTPSQAVVNCEVTLNGGVVVLALRGQLRPKTLQLRGSAGGATAAAAFAETRRYFGKPENHGKVVDLRTAER